MDGVNKSFLAGLALGLVIVFIVGLFFYPILKEREYRQTPTVLGSCKIDDFLIVFNSTWVTRKVLVPRSGILVPVRVAEPEHKLAVLNVTVFSLGMRETFFDPLSYPTQLKGPDGSSYTGKYYTRDWFTLMGFIKPHEKMSGYLVFQVPENTTAAELVLYRCSLTEKEIVYRMRLIIT